MGIERWKNCFAPSAVKPPTSQRPPKPRPPRVQQKWHTLLGDMKEEEPYETGVGESWNVGFKIDNGLYQRCLVLADRENISFSRLIREALRLMLRVDSAVNKAGNRNE